MIVREFEKEDADGLRRIFDATGFEYDFPDFSDAEFAVRKVLHDESGIAMGAFLRRTTEAFLLCDPAWRSPRWRYEALTLMHEAVRSEARARGINDVQALVPPQIEERFGKRLMQLGWRRNQWTCFSRSTE